MYSNRRCITCTTIVVQGRCIQCHQYIYIVLCSGNTKTRNGGGLKKEKRSWRCNACRYHFHWKCDGGTSMQRHDLTGAVLLLTTRSDRVGKRKEENRERAKEYDVRSRQGRCVTGRVAHETTFAVDHSEQRSNQH